MCLKVFNRIESSSTIPSQFIIVFAGLDLLAGFVKGVKFGNLLWALLGLVAWIVFRCIFICTSVDLKLHWSHFTTGFEFDFLGGPDLDSNLLGLFAHTNL